MNSNNNDADSGASPSNVGLATTEAEAERLVLEFGGDKYESFSPAVRLSSWKMARLIDHIRSEERAMVAN